MTSRRPDDVTFENWVEAQIADAARRGELSNLPGEGRPLPLEEHYDPDWWLKEMVRREGGVLTPEQLGVRRAVEVFLAELPGLRDERTVKERLDVLNARIVDGNRMTLAGPPTDVSELDAAAVLRRWKQLRRG